MIAAVWVFQWCWCLGYGSTTLSSLIYSLFGMLKSKTFNQDSDSSAQEFDFGASCQWLTPVILAT
jgi:hypothetical protein